LSYPEFPDIWNGELNMIPTGEQIESFIAPILTKLAYKGLSAAIGALVAFLAAKGLVAASVDPMTVLAVAGFLSAVLAHGLSHYAEVLLTKYGQSPWLAWLNVQPATKLGMRKS
jgi:hypothetical protein